jgi:hypothetical protein
LGAVPPGACESFSTEWQIAGITEERNGLRASFLIRLGIIRIEAAHKPRIIRWYREILWEGTISSTRVAPAPKATITYLESLLTTALAEVERLRGQSTLEAVQSRTAAQERYLDAFYALKHLQKTDADAL